MKIFVTGGSGFVGRRLICRLVKENHMVFALSRTESSDAVLKQLGAHPVRGSLSDIATWECELNEKDTVIHCAAPVEFWGAWEKFQAEIADASKNVAEAASRQKVKRFIYLSSESVLQDALPLLDIDESLPYPASQNSSYGRAKMLAEKALLSLSTDMKIVILRPTFVWGKGAPALELIANQVKAGKFVWIDGGRHSFEAVHVENLVEAIYLGIEHGRDKQIYLVTDGENATVRQFFEPLFGTLGLALPSKSLPSQLLRPVACAIEGIWKALSIRTSPPLTRFELSFVSMARRYSIDKIRNEFGYKQVVSRSAGYSELTGA